MTSLAVVIPTYRRPIVLLTLIESLFAGTQQPDEVIVVDNDPDTSQSTLKEAPQWPLRTIRAGLGLNLAAARNRGWRAARADICFFIDDDNTVGPRTLKALVEAFDEPNRGLVAPVIYESRNPTTVWCAGIRRSWWTTRTTFLLRGQDNLPNVPSWHTDDMPNALAIPLRVLQAVGGFDEVNFPFYYDEGDIARRICGLGLTTSVVRDAAVWHSGGTDSDPAAEMFRGLDLGGRRRLESMAYGRVFYHRLHSPSPQKVAALAVFVPIWYALVALACLRSRRSLHDKLVVLSALVKGLLRGYTRPISFERP